MISLDKKDKLKEAIALGEIHFARMDYARSKVASKFPLTENKYKLLTEDELSYLDQLIFRFSKLQDSMGNKLFPSLLENLGEDIENLPFIDLLNKLEKLELLDDHNQWLTLRETRNLVIHEYPFFTPEIVEGLNLLFQQLSILEIIWEKINSYVKTRFQI